MRRSRDILGCSYFGHPDPTPEPTVRQQHGESENEHRDEPAHGARKKRRVDLRERELGKLLAALDHPVPGGVGDERGQDDDAQPFRQHVFEEKIERGDQHQQHGDLSDLNPEVEPEQRGEEMVAGELQRFAQCEGEAEAVHEPERESDDPAPGNVARELSHA